MMTNEWKKAVFVSLSNRHCLGRGFLSLVGMHSTSASKAEEMLLGHEHLDAILDQSRHILETQHVDLIGGDPSRSHNRSSSASLNPRDWASDESDESST